MAPAWYEPLLDGGYMPIPLLRYGIRRQLQVRLNELAFPDVEKALADKLAFVASLRERPIAINTEDANKQHYEVSTEFIQMCLGPRMKYSCCLFPTGRESLAEAEEAMLASYVEKAQLKPGMSILDLGCGWGSLSLYLAEKLPTCKITSLSNSKTQKIFIDKTAAERGFKNLTVVTGDVKDHEFPDGSFDRVMSVEMFEHMKNYQFLLAKVSRWLKDEGKLFVHIFCHKTQPYDYKDGDGWMTDYFFTGGTMPSNDLFLYFQDDLAIEGHWAVNGKHYAQTCEEWLKLLLKNKRQAEPYLKQTYGEGEVTRWFNRWIVFYLACAELFAWGNGNEWFVSHYLFKKKPTAA
ncbi:S-adenosyl-L-methionine-dependent methyltransferase [Protomyces lactucae-debilis]|uniref:S-adenosyl-L-methionine-dependent methyltransferase n=1 Tax=Protomyces lactucae-debilis TaxID=2754530 RepID=A0A1Y2FS63_PROLT|nr:S-adenosyl-L-methionine-dependent methyltransferase [Protomyces lactucae-debilis]ORY86828.1 S-adenosyl-L-methionine-dependent methyltransferase [Protomyces lactucae-debilis]